MSEKRYTVEIQSRAEKSLRALPKAAATRLRQVIDALADEPRPHGYLKMKGFENQYRVRDGNYRILYSIFDDKLVVEVINVGPRKDIYR